MILDAASLTVSSYSTFKSCIAFANLLYKYPDLGVLSAVSIKESLPVIAPKKNSHGFNPCLKPCLINPCAEGPRSFFLKHDNVLCVYPESILFPPNACCPTQADICESCNTPPLAPDCTITIVSVFLSNFSEISSPILFLAVFNNSSILSSNVSFNDLPGKVSKFPLWNCSTRAFTLSSAFFSIDSIVALDSLFKSVSDKLDVNPLI